MMVTRKGAAAAVMGQKRPHLGACEKPISDRDLFNGGILIVERGKPTGPPNPGGNVRTLGEFRLLKADALACVTAHAEIQNLLSSNPFKGRWPNPAKVEIHCHWDQSMSLVLTETALGQECFGVRHLRRIVAEAIPCARIFGTDSKPAQSLCLVKTRVSFSIPEGMTLESLVPSTSKS